MMDERRVQNSRPGLTAQEQTEPADETDFHVSSVFSFSSDFENSSGTLPAAVALTNTSPVQFSRSTTSPFLGTPHRDEGPAMRRPYGNTMTSPFIPRLS